MNTKGVEDGIPEKFVCTDPECFGDCHPIRAVPVEERTAMRSIKDRVWIASYTASEHASVLCRGLHFRSIHNSKEDAELIFHDPQSPDFTVTEYVKVAPEPVADGGGLPPLDEECSDSDVVLRAVRWTGRCFALIDEDAEDDVIAEGESADHAGIEAEWDLIRRERQLASSQEVLRLAREARLNDQKVIIAKCEEVKELRERMQQAVARLNKAAAEKDLVEEVLDEVSRGEQPMTSENTKSPPKRACKHEFLYDDSGGFSPCTKCGAKLAEGSTKS